MTPTHFRSLAAAALALGFLVALVLLPRGGAAQEPKEKAAAPPAELLSAAHCIQCHSGPGSPGYEAYKQEGRTEFITLDEYRVWHDRDLHAVALENIRPEKSAVARQMQDILARSPSRKGVVDYRVDRADECLTCHAVDRKPRPVTAGEAHADRFFTSAGVSCEACHGLVTGDWLGRHIQKSWRDRAPAEKAAFNQVDLRDPYTRAKKCASCHVGNKAEGKFVTHEMYAAGHPPLPPFELATFANDAPPHYHPPRQNNFLASRPADEAWKYFHYRKDEIPEARSVAIGTLAAFEAGMTLLADDAKATKTGELLDFAHFDCYACHHDLKYPSWRQKHGYQGPPGRPTPRTYAADTLLVILAHAGGASAVETEPVARSAGEIRDRLEKLKQAFAAKPFGQRNEVAELASLVAKPCSDLNTHLSPLVYDEAQAKVLYQRLAEHLQRGGRWLDADSAQHSVWALNALRRELHGASGHAKIIGELEKFTALDVRPKEREPVAGPRLKARQERVAAFDPDAFLPLAKEWLKPADPK